MKKRNVKRSALLDYVKDGCAVYGLRTFPPVERSGALRQSATWRGSQFNRHLLTVSPMVRSVHAANAVHRVRPVPP